MAYCGGKQMQISDCENIRFLPGTCLRLVGLISCCYAFAKILPCETKSPPNGGSAPPLFEIT